MTSFQPSSLSFLLGRPLNQSTPTPNRTSSSESGRASMQSSSPPSSGESFRQYLLDARRMVREKQGRYSMVLNQNLISETAFQTMLRNIVRILCNWEHKKEIDHVFIKATVFMAPAFPLLKKMFPRAKFVFNTRNFQSSSESYMQLILYNGIFVNLTGEMAQVRSLKCQSLICSKVLTQTLLSVCPGQSSNTT